MNKPKINIIYGKEKRQYGIEHKHEMMNKAQCLFDNDLFAWSFTIFWLIVLAAMATYFTGGWSGIRFLFTLL